MKKFLLVALSAIFLASYTFALKPYPRGIISVLQSDTIGNPLGDISVEYDDELANPIVTALRFRGVANIVNPTCGQYNWTKIEEARTDCIANGKKLTISVSWGVSTPEWVYDKGAYKYTLINTPTDSMPLPWDTAYKNLLLKFIKAFGAKYDGDPNVDGIIVTGFMSQTSMFLADADDYAAMNALAIASGYASADEAYRQGATAIIDMWAAHFPNTALIVDTARVFDAPLGQQDMTFVRNYGLDTYPFHFGTMFNGLQASEPPFPAPSPTPSYPKGFQSIFPAHSEPNIYVNPPGPPVPFPADPTPLEHHLGRAYMLGGQFVELYKPDIEDVAPGRQAVLEAATVLLLQNIPPGH